MTIGFGASCTPSPISLATMSFEQKNGQGACPHGARCFLIMGKVLAPVGQILRQAVAQNVLITDRAFKIKRPALPEEERQG